LTSHSLDRDLVVRKTTITSIPIEVRRIGISNIVRNDVVILPAVPKVVINENAMGPQEHAPADAPKIVPMILVPIFRVCFISFTR
tara:strand:+ start:132 stop:386 length:255 start_codon:yes stop_codon:yes gene_type:complete